MDQATKERMRRELKEEADKLLPGGVREVTLLEYGDDPMVEPGETTVRVNGPREGQAPDGEFTPVMVRLRGPELEPGPGRGNFYHQFGRRLLEEGLEGAGVIVCQV